MSLLAEYYNSIARENAAKVEQARAQADQLRVQTGQIGPNAQSARDEAASRMRSNDAGSNRLNKEAGQVDANAASTRALQASQATGFDTTARLAGPLAQSEIGLRGAQANESNTLAKVQQYQGVDPSTYLGMPVAPYSPGLGITTGLGATSDGTPDPNATQPEQIQGDSKGGKIKTQKEVVQGKAAKPGPTDTVPAMLTPGEAVLNKGAVHHYGTDVIDHMNKMGLLRMGAQSEVAKHLGLPDPHAPPQKGKDGKADDSKDTKSKGKGKAAAGFAKGGLVPGELPVLPIHVHIADRGMI